MVHISKYETEGYEELYKTVKKYGKSHSCMIYLPSDWAGADVKVIRLTKIKKNGRR